MLKALKNSTAMGLVTGPWQRAGTEAKGSDPISIQEIRGSRVGLDFITTHSHSTSDLDTSR